jgi:uncharacterized protein
MSQCQANIRRIVEFKSQDLTPFHSYLTIVYSCNIHKVMDIDMSLSKCTGFEWDEGNLLKNWEKHRVSASECEQVFFNRPLVAGPDFGHSRDEARFYVLGQADTGRCLFIVFTIRKKLIRIISARDMNPKERNTYKSYEKNP